MIVSKINRTKLETVFYSLYHCAAIIFPRTVHCSTCGDIQLANLINLTVLLSLISEVWKIYENYIVTC